MERSQKPDNPYINEVLQSNQRLSVLFSELERFDYSAWLHSYRVGIKCFAIARFKKLDTDLTKLFVLGGLFHDIGKICLPFALINKIGKLTYEEKLAINFHARIGYYLLVDVSYDLAYLVYFHHQSSTKENLPQFRPTDDFPSGMRITFTDISVNARDALIPLLICADEIDALLHSRVYRKKPWRKERIYKHLVNKFPDSEQVISFLLSLSNDNSCG